MPQREMDVPSLLGVFTDYDTLCAPHIPAIRDVLAGKTSRYKLKHQNATLVFHHGCLMTQVVHDGLIRALPPITLGPDGTPCLRARPAHRQAWLDEFLTLPKSVLLFTFSLLKHVFKGQALACRHEDPDTGLRILAPVPTELRPILAEVGWHIR